MIQQRPMRPNGAPSPAILPHLVGRLLLNAVRVRRRSSVGVGRARYGEGYYPSIPYRVAVVSGGESGPHVNAPRGRRAHMVKRPIGSERFESAAGFP